MFEHRRDVYFDNVKGILIFLVSCGHILYYLSECSHVVYVVYHLIYVFHMPAFVFVSGWFSRQGSETRILAKWFRRALRPYVVGMALYMAYDLLVSGASWSWHMLVVRFLIPNRGMWYLFCLFSWGAACDAFDRLISGRRMVIVPCGVVSVLFAVGVSLIVGYVDCVGEYMALSRMIYFFPFFAAGRLARISGCRLDAVRGHRVLCMAGFICTVVMCVTMFRWNRLNLGEMSGDVGYSVSGGYWLTRLFCYGIAASMSFVVFAAVPRRDTVFSKFGENTLCIFMFEWILVRMVVIVLVGLCQLDVHWLFDYAVLSAVACVGICFLVCTALSRDRFVRVLRPLLLGRFFAKSV